MPFMAADRHPCTGHAGPAATIRSLVTRRDAAGGQGLDTVRTRFQLSPAGARVPIGLAFFILFPRLASPLWGIPETTLDSKSGFQIRCPREHPGPVHGRQPGIQGGVFRSCTPPATACTGEAPFSGALTAAPGKAAFTVKILRPRTAGARESAWEYTVQLEPNERKWLFALDYPASVPPDTRLTMDYQLIRRHPVIQLTQYSIVSNPNFIDAPELSGPLRAAGARLAGWTTIPEPGN